MGRFQKTLDQIKSMFQQLSFSQRMLIATLLVLIVVCVVWMMKYAGTSDRVPVLDQAFEADESGRMVTALKAAGINALVASDGKVMVAPDDRLQAHYVLTANNALPHDFSFGFEQLVKDSNIWQSPAEFEMKKDVAERNQIASVFRQFPNVLDAQVLIDRPQKRGFGSAQGQPSAAVHLRMRPGQTIDKKMVNAVADYICGAVRDMPRDRVRVIDSTNGRSYRVPSEEAGMPADYLELTTQHEEKCVRSIMKVIGHIEGVLVTADVKLDPATRKETEVKVDKDNAVSVVASETSHKSTSADGSGGGGEPGVALNTGGAAVANTAASAGSKSSDNEEQTTYDTKIGEKRTETVHMPGMVQSVTASVNIPYSYFVTAYKAETDQDKPDPAALKTFIGNEIGRIKPMVKAAIGSDPAEDDKVVISYFYDKVAESAQTQPAVESAGMIAALWQRAPSIGLGALAVISLLMMLMMMRRAASGAGTLAAETQGQGAAVQAAGAAYGPQSAGGAARKPVPGLLDDMEPDEEAQRTQQMVEQVTHLVQENPDAAATLVRRWIGKGAK
ncbi:MAG: hypothetical protein BIFFINMI_03038 [Phycisphaerae bacterium]|nr:hypothetical protein [Phycisphaerae bacterium]